MNRSKLIILAALTATASAYADELTVNTALGTLPYGQVLLSGNSDAPGLSNKASTWTSLSNIGNTAYDRNEVVYSFTLSKPAYLYMKDTLEPDNFPGMPTAASDHDYFLTQTLTTTNANNTPTSTFLVGYFTGKQEGQSIGFTTASFGDSSSGVSPFPGLITNPGPSSANPDRVAHSELYPAGTYYLVVDAIGTVGTTNAFTNGRPAGNFTAKLNVAYADEITAPASTPTKVDAAGKITGTYNASGNNFYSFNYTGGAFSIDTYNSSLSNNNDTFIALYNSAGLVVAFNDQTPESPIGSLSKLSFTDGQLAPGTYYLAFSAWKAEALPGFDFSYYNRYDPLVFPGGLPTATGTFVINGLAVIPEPSAAALLLSTALLSLRRHRA